MGAPKGNKYALGNDGGRPPIHTDPNEVDRLINDYFEYIKGEFEIKHGVNEEGQPFEYEHWIRRPEPPTVTGLTLHLGFSNKSSIYEYSERKEFTNSIKRALTRIEQYHEIAVSRGDKCAGNIFVLKNFGWHDKTEVTQTNFNHNSAELTQEQMDKLIDKL